MTTNQPDFTFSDLIMGYVEAFDGERDVLTVTTTDDRRFQVTLGPLTFAETVRNLGEDYRDATGVMRERFTPGRLLFVYGTFLPCDSGVRFEAKRVVFTGDGPDEARFEERTWWVDQIRELAEYYLEAELGADIDWCGYRTTLSADGAKSHVDTHRQECDTISRLVYGFASAFMLTGDERFLTAAERGTEYLREHFRAVDEDAGIAYWYHAVDRTEAGGDGDHARVRKILASTFGDDYDAIPLYEQIYALAGPVQTYRATGDGRVLDDVKASVELFDRYFLDDQGGGYFSHVDPVSFDPRAEGLGHDRARKNWNSVGDHAPAYLINVVVATGGDPRWVDMLARTADTIVEHFGDYEHSPFVNERFFEDWSHDQSWGWQQDRAVVGHNLKIAWNLLRVQHTAPRDEYVAFARRIAEVMPAAGSDQQRGGWYDVVERTKADGDRYFPFAWHDRKAWWQQEQAILAYLILAGSLGDAEYRRLARESAAFYNAFFLDHDSGGVFFNVLASGVPYLVGTERLKGSHSMAGYHSFELCYLAATYTNLLLTGQPLDLYFKPVARDLCDRTLRVAPDLLPAGAVKIGRVWLDGVASDSFDADTLTVRIPDELDRPLVRVELVPAAAAASHYARCDVVGASATVTLSGVLDPTTVAELQQVLAGTRDRDVRRVVFDLAEVDSLSPEAVRALAFAVQKLDPGCEVTTTGASPAVRDQLAAADLAESMQFA